MKPTIALLALVPIMALAACSSGPTEEEREAAKEARSKATKLADRADEATAVAISCRQQLGGLLQALRNTGSRLSVGLPFAEYSNQVGQISIAYDRMPIGRMDPECISVTGVKAEQAFNSYTKAYNTWNDCISDLYCDMDSVDLELQDAWVKGDRQTSQARAGLVDLEVTAVEAEESAERQEEKAKQAEATLET